MGRHYQISEWAEFEIDGLAEGEAQDHGLRVDLIQDEVVLTKKFNKTQERFTREANRVVGKWLDKHPDAEKELEKQRHGLHDDDIAWYTYAAFEGHGIGFWEHITKADWEDLKQTLYSDKRLRTAFSAMQDAIYNATATAAARALKDYSDGRRDHNPKPAKKPAKRPVGNPPRGEVNEIAATELLLYADNTAELYRQKQSIEANLARKVKSGKYNAKLAPKAWLHWLTEAAKRYVKEFGSGRWSDMFNVPTRMAAAEEAARNWEAEHGVARGNPCLPCLIGINPKKTKPAKKKATGARNLVARALK